MEQHWLESAIAQFCRHFPPGTFFSLGFNVKALLAILLVSLICGAIGSLVVGNRMAFFCDALAHSAFAGIALGFLLAVAAGMKDPNQFDRWITPVMAAFGIIVGLGIAIVRDKSTLASDTVIGVFFAGSMGMGALLLGHIKSISYKYANAENFIFGNPVDVPTQDVVLLIWLAVLTFGFLALFFNDLVFASMNQSLARSRNVRVRLCSYLFIVLLGLVVNLSLSTIGPLLINGMLIVPAATMANLCRNMRQMFWGTVLLSVALGIAGQWLAWEVGVGLKFDISTGGVVVVLSVIVFFLSMTVSALRRKPA